MRQRCIAHDIPWRIAKAMFRIFAVFAVWMTLAPQVSAMAHDHGSHGAGAPSHHAVSILDDDSTGSRAQHVENRSAGNASDPCLPAHAGHPAGHPGCCAGIASCVSGCGAAILADDMPILVGIQDSSTALTAWSSVGFDAAPEDPPPRSPIA
jgi:hypothetical protein